MTKHLRLLAIIASVAILIAACTGTEATTAPGTDAPATVAPATDAPPASEPAGAALEGTLTLWHTYSSGAGTELDALNEILDEVRAENPGLTLNVLEVPFNDVFNKYNADAATGAGPDLFIAPNDSLGFQAREGVIADLEMYLAGNLGDITDTAVEGSKVDGMLYMVPESLKAVAMYYNADTVTTVPATTQELLDAVSAGTYTAGFFGGANGAYHNFGWWAAFGGQLMDETGTCIADQGGVAEAHAYLAELQAAGAKFFPNYDDMANGFKDGSLDLIIDGPWASGGYRETVANLGVAPMPAGPAGPAQPLSGVDGWYINPNSANIELAVAFALRTTDQSAQQIFVDKAGHIPANANIAITDPLTQGFADAVATGFPRPQVKELDNFWGNFGNALQQVLETDADATNAIATACSEMNTANGK